MDCVACDTQNPISFHGLNINFEEGKSQNKNLSTQQTRANITKRGGAHRRQTVDLSIDPQLISSGAPADSEMMTRDRGKGGPSELIIKQI